MLSSPTTTRVTAAAVAAVLSATAVVLPTTLSWAQETDEDDALEQAIDPDQDVAEGVAELTAGHIDLGPRYLAAEESGDVDDAADERAWTLMVHDDQSYDDDAAESVWRHADETVLRVHDTAALPVPDEEAYSFLGVDPGQNVHVVPQTQDPDVIWLGWNTQDPEVMDTIDRGVTMSLVGAEGPGHVVVYLQSGSFEEPDVLWDSRSDEEQPAWIPVNTHTHANWVFTDPGVHLVHLEAEAELIDGSTVSDTRALRFAVGDEVTVDDALAAEPTIDLPDGAADEADDDAGADEPNTADNDPSGTADDSDVDDSDVDDSVAPIDGEEATDAGGMSPAVWIIIAVAVLIVIGGVIVGLNARRSRARAFAHRDVGGKP